MTCWTYLRSERDWNLKAAKDAKHRNGFRCSEWVDYHIRSARDLHKRMMKHPSFIAGIGRRSFCH